VVVEIAIRKRGGRLAQGEGGGKQRVGMRLSTGGSRKVRRTATEEDRRVQGEL